MSKNLPLISVVIPVYNESANIQWFYEELTGLLSKEKGIDYELVYVNDGSSDDTGELLEKLSSQDPRVLYVCLARNFGKEAATSAGIHTANGNAVAILDGDGQHPPVVMLEMIKRWRSGVQQVVGIRTSNKKAGFAKTIGSKIFYTLSKSLGAQSVVANATDFRLIDRELVDAFSRFTEKKRMTRALLDWSGFKTEYVEFEARQREYGTATYNIKSLMRLAVNGYIGATLKPLYFVGIVGSFVTVASLLALIFLALSQYAFGDPLSLGVTGSAFMTLFITMLVGALMISQGIVALYVANIHLEAQDRPLYIINKAHSKLH